MGGTWTVRQIPGSPVLEAVDISLGLPDVQVSADLHQAGTDLSFDYSVLEVEGQSVSFVERKALVPVWLLTLLSAIWSPIIMWWTARMKFP